jgi:hypothetical protein
MLINTATNNINMVSPLELNIPEFRAFTASRAVLDEREKAISSMQSTINAICDLSIFVHGEF